MERNVNVADEEDDFSSPEREEANFFFRFCLLSAGAPWILLIWVFLLTTPDPSVANMKIVQHELRSPIMGPCREFILAITPSISGTDNCMEGHHGLCSFMQTQMACDPDDDCSEALVTPELDESDRDDLEDLKMNGIGEEEELEDFDRHMNSKNNYNNIDGERGMVQQEHAEKNDEAAYSTRNFGSYYANEYEAKTLTLRQLEESGDIFQIATAKLAMTWLQSQGKTVFKVVGNLEFLRTYQEIDTRHIQFIRLERSSNEIHFIFQEMSPGAATEALLLAMVNEIRSGGGGWDDFGIVHSSCASECGFRNEWDGNLLLAGISKRAHKVCIRVDLADKHARVLGLVAPAPKVCQSFGSLYHHDRFDFRFRNWLGR
jgi:hypothetical protein